MPQTKPIYNVEDLCLIINMTGNEFDTELNFGMIVIASESTKQFTILDITSTEGYASEDDELAGYELYCKFEYDFDEIKEIAEGMTFHTEMGGVEEYTLTEDIHALLALDDIKASTNLAYCCDEEKSKENIKRIQTIALRKYRKESAIDYAVQQDNNL